MSDIDDIWNNIGAPSSPSGLTNKPEVDALWNGANASTTSSFDFLSPQQDKLQPQPVDRAAAMAPVVGAVQGLSNAVEMFARDYRLGNIPDTEAEQSTPSYVGKFANWLIINKDKFEKEHPYWYGEKPDESRAESWLRQGVASNVQSLAANIPGSFVGARTGAAVGSLIPGAGNAVGGAVGAVAGWGTSAGTAFGLAEYDQFVQDVVEHNQQHPDSKIPESVYRSEALKSAIVEGGLEAASDMVVGGALKIGSLTTKPVKDTVASILNLGWKGGSKAFLKAQALAQPSEVSTEMGQNYLETKLRKDLGLENQDPREVAISAIGPTVVSTLLMGAGAHALDVRQRGQIAKALEDPSTDFDTRFDAMKVIHDELRKSDKVNGTDLATVWSKVAEYKLMEGEGLDLHESLRDMKPIESVLAGKEQDAQLEADVTKFEDRGKPKVDQPEVLPEEEQAKIDADKTVRQTMGFETRDMIYQQFLNKGFDEKRAYDLTAQIMGAKDLSKPPVQTTNSSILGENGEPIKKEVPPVSTEGANKLSLGETLIQKIPDALRNQLVMSAKGGFFSSTGAVKAILKKQGLSDTYAPFAVAPGEYVGAPVQLAQTAQDLAGITAGRFAPKLYVPDNLQVQQKNTPVQQTQQETYPGVLPTDITNKGVPYTNKVSAGRAVTRTMKEMNLSEGMLEPVQIAEGQWVARQKKNITPETKFESAAEYVTRRNPEYLAVKDEPAKALDKLDEIITGAVEAGHEGTRPHKGLLRRHELLVNHIAHEEQEQKTKEVKKVVSAPKPEVKSEDVASEKGGESNDLQQEKEALLKEEPVLLKSETKENTLLKQNAVSREKVEQLKAKAVETHLKAGEDVPTADVEKFKIVKLRWSKNQDGKWEEHEPEYKTKKTLSLEERERLDDQRAIQRADKQPRKEAKTVSANNLIRKAHKELLKIKSDLETEKDPSKQEELKDALASARQDIRILANRVLQGEGSKGIKWFGDQEDVTQTEHPLAKNVMYQSPVMAQTQVDAYTTLEPDTGQRLLKNMSPLAMPRAFASMINYAMHYGDGTVNLEMINKYLDQLTSGLDDGKLDNYLDRDDRNAKVDFKDSITAVRQYLKTVLSHLATTQTENAQEKDDQVVADTLDPKKKRPRLDVLKEETDQAAKAFDEELEKNKPKFSIVEALPADMQAEADKFNLTYNGEMGLGEKKIYLFTEPKYGATFTVKRNESITVNLQKKITDFENAGNKPLNDIKYFFSRLVMQLSPMAQKAKGIFGTDNDPRGIGKYLFPDGSFSSGTNLPENQGIAKSNKGYVFDGMEHSDVYRLYDNAKPADGYELIPKFINESGCIRMQLYTAYKNNKETFEDLFVEVGKETRVTQAQLNQLKSLLEKGSGTLIYEITGVDGKQITSGETHSVNDMLRDLAESRFLKTGGKTTHGMTIKDVRGVVDQLTNEWVNKPWFVTVETRSQLPQEILAYCANDSENVRIGGVTHYDTIYLVADELLGKQDAARVIMHEAIGHYGIANTLGEKFNVTLEYIYNRFADDDAMHEIVKTYQFDVSKREDQISAGAEFLAHTAETTDLSKAEYKTVWQTVCDKVREILRSFGLNIKLNNSDVTRLLTDSYRFVTKDAQAGQANIQNFFTEPKFSRIVDYSDRTNQSKQSEFPGRGTKEFFTEESRLLLKALAQNLPRNAPALNAPARYLLSPEWYDHPILKKIVAAAINRHDRYYELFNRLNEFGKDENGKEVIIKGATSMIDLVMKLKHKGLTKWQIVKGQASKEYNELERVVDEGDTGEWKKRYEGQAAQPSYMEHLQQTKVDKDVIELYSLYRKQYDNALDMLIEPMQKLVEAIDAHAAKTKAKPKYPTFTVTDDHGKMVQINLKDVVSRMGQLRGTYAPRMREIGEWVIEGSRGDKHVRYQKSNYFAASSLKKILEMKGYNIKPLHERERLSEDVYGALRIVNTATAIKNAMDHMDYSDPELKAKFNEELIHEVADLLRIRGYRSSMVARKPGDAIRGYITDPNERFVRYINNISAGVAKSEAAEQMFKHLTGYTEGENKKKIEGIDPGKDHRAYDTATQYITEQLRNSDAMDRMIGLVKSFATFKYLGFNPRSALVNITSLLTTVPTAIHTYTLGGKGSMTKIGMTLGAASKDYASVMQGKKLLNPHEQGLMDEIKLKGYDTPQYTRDAVGTIQRAHGKAWAKTMQYAMYMFGKSEQWIRGTTILASYRLAKLNKPNLSETELRDLAHQTSNKAHGIYGKATQLAVGQGTGPGARLAQVLYTYAKFPHNYVQMLYDSGFKKKDIKAFTYGLLSSVILGGAEVLMFKSAVVAIAGAILKSFGDDDDPEKLFWDWVREKFGKFTERTLRHGTLGAANVDVSSSLSIGIGLPKDFYELFGVAGGLTKDIQDAKHFLGIGQYGRASEKVLPTAAANLFKAYRELNGVVNTRGQRVWNDEGEPYIPTVTETALRTFGVRSANEAVAQERTWELNKEIENYKARRGHITEMYRDWVIDNGSDEDLTKIMDKVTAYNDKLIERDKVGEIPLIKKSTLKKVAKSAFAPRKSVLMGLDND